MFFAKVFAQILSSSLAEDWQVRHVFEDLLKLANPDGTVDMTPQSIARMTNTPFEVVSRGLAELEKPDVQSRSREANGCRIVLLDPHRDWGWRIVNFRKYHESATVEMLRMAERERKQAYRAKFGKKKEPKKKEDPKETDIEGELSRDKSGTVRDSARFVPPSLEEVKLQAAKTGLPEIQAIAFWNYWESCGWRRRSGPMKTWPGSMVTWKIKWEQDGRPMPKPTKEELQKLNSQLAEAYYRDPKHCDPNAYHEGD